MVFLDTSALFVLADKADENHEETRNRFRRAIESGEEFLVHNYILVETAALFQRRLGAMPAKRFLMEAERFSVFWVDSALHRRAVEYFERKVGRNLSFVDCVSFVLMREKGIMCALAVDEDFDKAGFQRF